MINRLLNECLGWPYSDFRAERHHDSGYSDYVLVNDDSPVLLIEAKRMGIIEIATTERDKVRYLKLKGSGLKKANKGIDQAASYAAPNGIPIAVLTDGISWIIFKTFTAGENYKLKEAVVFPSLDSIINDFSIFYDLLSKAQYSNRVYKLFFDNLHNKRLLLSQELLPPLNNVDIKLSQKSEIAFDLDRVFTSFFSRLTGDNDEDLLIECFVETRESRIADFSLEKMTKNVLGNMVPTEKSVVSELTNVIEYNVDSQISSTESGQTIFIVGPTGAGKTTFLDRFFRRTLPNSIRQKCALIRVNYLDSTGSEETALDWMTESLISIMEKEIFPTGAPTWNDLLGLYHLEYKIRS